MKRILSAVNLFLLVTVCACLVDCGGLSTGSYIAVYRGKILTGTHPVDTTIEIITSGRGRQIIVSGKVSPTLHPFHPDTSGFFTTWSTSPDYGELEDPPPHWESGPLEILITHPAFKSFHDTLSKEDLKSLAQITPEAAGIKLERIEKGVWVLPDITLRPK